MTVGYGRGTEPLVGTVCFGLVSAWFQPIAGLTKMPKALFLMAWSWIIFVEFMRALGPLILRPLYTARISCGGLGLLLLMLARPIATMATFIVTATCISRLVASECA